MNRIALVSLLFAVTAACTPANESTPTNPSTPAFSDGKADSLHPDTFEPEEEPRLDAPLTSREFKVMLEPSLFEGKSVEDMLGYLQEEIDSKFPMEAEDLELTNLRKERTVQYLDVPGSCDFRNKGYTLRQRVKEGEQEATLKFRSPERYLASATSVASSHPEMEWKFEEDVKPGYASVFSRSTDVPMQLGTTFANVGEARAQYESIAALELSDDATLAPVGGLTIYEKQYGRIKYDLGEFKAKMVVTLWSTEPEGEPIVAELSFEYEEDEDKFDVPSVRNGMELFRVIEGLHEWRATNSTTKTSFVYEYADGFCD